MFMLYSHDNCNFVFGKLHFNYIPFGKGPNRSKQTNFRELTLFITWVFKEKEFLLFNQLLDLPLLWRLQVTVKQENWKKPEGLNWCTLKNPSQVADRWDNRKHHQLHSRERVFLSILELRSSYDEAEIIKIDINSQKRLLGNCVVLSENIWLLFF